MGGHGHVDVNGVLGVLVVAGVTIPVLTVLRLCITLRGGGGDSGTRRYSRTRRFGMRLAGEWLVVGVAVLSTVQAVLWGWNAVEEIVLQRRELDGQTMTPGVGYLKVCIAVILPSFPSCLPVPFSLPELAGAGLLPNPG